MLNLEPTAALQLFRIKRSWQEFFANHGWVTVHSALDHASLATAWISRQTFCNTVVAYQVHAAWFENLGPFPLHISTFSLPIGTHTQHCERLRTTTLLDRLIIDKHHVYVRNRTMIHNEHHVPHYQHWQKFPRPL